MNIQKVVIVVYNLANPFHKKKAHTAIGSGSANNTVSITAECQEWEVSSNAVHGNAS